MAWLDRMAPIKHVAQVGAAIGREFSYELIAALNVMSETSLAAALSQTADRRSAESAQGQTF
jgi:predicted ATPase